MAKIAANMCECSRHFPRGKRRMRIMVQYVSARVSSFASLNIRTQFTDEGKLEYTEKPSKHDRDQQTRARLVGGRIAQTVEKFIIENKCIDLLNNQTKDFLTLNITILVATTYIHMQLHANSVHKILVHCV